MMAEVIPMREKATPVTEDALAVLVAREHGRDIRWCPQRKAWYVWDGAIWKLDESGQVFEMAREVCRLHVALTGKEKWGRHAAVTGVERFLRTQPELVVPAASWDADPLVLGTPNGFVDLTTGKFCKPERERLITKATTVDPSPEGEEPYLWLEFLDSVTQGDDELIRYLKRIAGYALTGLVRDHVLIFVYGPGGNGKGTFLDTVRSIMGAYVVHSPTETFMTAISGRHPTELAMLQGARLVTGSETNEGQAWDEAKIKALTGGDPITARFTHKDFFTFEPTHKLVIIGNHRPVLRNVDAAMRRRLRMIPFKFTPARDDKDLRVKLRAEFPQILRWMIDGCLDWQTDDMDLPEVVRVETYEYFADQDAVGQWLRECCEIDDRAVPDEHLDRCLSSRLFASWAKWAKANGEPPGTNKRLSEEMSRRGFRKKRGAAGIEFYGIRLKTPDPTQDMYDP